MVPSTCDGIISKSKDTTCNMYDVSGFIEKIFILIVIYYLFDAFVVCCCCLLLLLLYFL